MDDERETQDSTQDDDDLFDDETDSGSDAGSDESDDASDDAPPADKKGTGKRTNWEKRVNDLMSKWQSAEAEKRRLKAELAELRGQAGTSNGGNASQGAPQVDPATNEFLELAREQARSSLFNSDPRLAQYGFEVTAIEGDSAKEMQASLKRLQGVLDKVEGSARQSVMKEFGLTPEVTFGGRDKGGYDPLTASDDEVLKMADRVLGRG